MFLKAGLNRTQFSRYGDGWYTNNYNDGSGKGNGVGNSRYGDNGCGEGHFFGVLGNGESASTSALLGIGGYKSWEN